MSDDLVMSIASNVMREAADRIKELEDKLAKAVEALDWCAKVHDIGVARDTLAEIKGETDE